MSRVMLEEGTGQLFSLTEFRSLNMSRVMDRSVVQFDRVKITQHVKGDGQVSCSV